MLTSEYKDNEGDDGPPSCDLACVKISRHLYGSLLRGLGNVLIQLGSSCTEDSQLRRDDEIVER
jgi:hypothetical protein